jgi:putative phosphoesterase
VKIALLADIHSNLVALEAVAARVDAWKPDVVLVAGDIINRGPRPRECLEYLLGRMQRDAWRVIRGNHERYVMHVAHDPAPTTGLNEAIRVPIRWTFAQLGSIDQIEALPTEVDLQGPDGGEIRMVHASMRHDRDNINLDTRDEELRQKIAPPPAVFCCGHTHRPLVRTIDSTLVVNAGSVGLPFDGDSRACWATIERNSSGWEAQILRVVYDRERARQDFLCSGLMDPRRASRRPAVYVLVGRTLQ